jgi:hypothetical protein
MKLALTVMGEQFAMGLRGRARQGHQPDSQQRKLWQPHSLFQSFVLTETQTQVERWKKIFIFTTRFMYQTFVPFNFLN